VITKSLQIFFDQKLKMNLIFKIVGVTAVESLGTSKRLDKTLPWVPTFDNREWVNEGQKGILSFA
jgi:hypothetical protein